MKRAWIVLCLCFAAPAWAGDGLPPALLQVGITQKVGASVPLDVTLLDEEGRRVPLSAYLGQRPVILVPTYYECPMLCTQVLNDLTGSLKSLRWSVGQDFDVVAVSFDPRDTPALAAAKKAAYLRRYGRPASAPGWHFLTGGKAEQPAVQRLMAAIGFRYVYDPAIQQYAHAATIVLLMPQGKISQYLLGIDYPPRSLRLALADASQGKLGTVIERLLLFCYHYDPTRGKYGRQVMGVVRAGGAVTLLGLFGMMFVFLRRERQRGLRREVA